MSAERLVPYVLVTLWQTKVRAGLWHLSGAERTSGVGGPWSPFDPTRKSDDEMAALEAITLVEFLLAAKLATVFEAAMKRRDFIGLVGGAAAWPFSALAQQPSMSVIGWLDAATLQGTALQLEAFRRGLSETGFVEGHNVRIEYRWAENRYGLLPAMAADLVSRKVDVIVANNQSAAALAAKAATSTIPIVFRFGADPIKVGLVPRLDRPGGNVTGVTTFSVELNKKKLGILHGLIPTTAVIALLVNTESPTANSVVQELQKAAQELGRRLSVLWASNEREIDTAFDSIAEQNAGGLYVTPDGFLSVRYGQIATLAVRHKIAAIHESRFFPQSGGLMTYGADSLEAQRMAGIYTGRILRGMKPDDLPVLQPTKFFFVINLKAASALGITIPKELQIQATELIE